MWRNLKYCTTFCPERLRKTMRIITEEKEGGEIKDGQLRMEKGTAEYRYEKRTEVRKRGFRAVRMKCGKWEIRIQGR
jgi:hypothetical protein